MKCQHCAKNEATVHLVELADGRRRTFWLCADCAEAEEWRRIELSGPASPPAGDADTTFVCFGEAADRTGAAADSEGESLADFLGTEPAAGFREAAGPAPACSHCGCTWAAFRQTNRLGCAHCYEVFGAQLLPMLAGFHRHPSHMGKAPRYRDARSSRLVEVTKARIALERAIATENFEEAARLRDLVRSLLEGRDEAPQDGGGRP